MTILDPVPIAMVFVLFAIVTLACYEIGFRIGRWWQDRMPGEQEGPTDMLVGSLLALMAFMLAVTMGMAADRFDARRGNVLAEANAIGTAYLQADYLPEPQAGADEGAAAGVPAPAHRSDDRSRSRRTSSAPSQLHAEMWAIAAEAARSGHSPDLVSRAR